VLRESYHWYTILTPQSRLEQRELPSFLVVLLTKKNKWSKKGIGLISILWHPVTVIIKNNSRIELTVQGTAVTDPKQRTPNFLL